MYLAELKVSFVLCAAKARRTVPPRFGAARAGPETKGKPVADTRPPERRPAANVLRLIPLDPAVSSCLNAVLIFFAIAPSVAASGRVTGCRGYARGRCLGIISTTCEAADAVNRRSSHAAA